MIFHAAYAAYDSKENTQMICMSKVSIALVVVFLPLVFCIEAHHCSHAVHSLITFKLSDSGFLRLLERFFICRFGVSVSYNPTLAALK